MDLWPAPILSMALSQLGESRSRVWMWRSAVGAASAAAALATDKRAKYDAALRRVRARPGQRTVKFWPLALECNGAWGADMLSP